MDTKKISEIIESINSVSLKIKDIPKEDFSKFLKHELDSVKSSDSRESIKLFVQNLPRNIVFEVEDEEVNKDKF
ncbi:MAG: hypothetical protein N2254_06075 [bacterium]|nr:hypothetical protein [bacterium]